MWQPCSTTLMNDAAQSEWISPRGAITPITGGAPSRRATPNGLWFSVARLNIKNSSAYEYVLPAQTQRKPIF